MKVSIIGSGHIGAAVAARLLGRAYVDDVVLLDQLDGFAAGIALDLRHMAAIDATSTRVQGTTQYEPTAGSDVVVITAGKRRRPGTSRRDLLEDNGRTMGDIVEQVMAHSADPVIIVVTNPLDEMTWLAADVSGLPRRQVVGMGGVLDSARLRYQVSRHASAPLEEVEGTVIGPHSDEMLAPPAHVRIAGAGAAERMTEQQLESAVEQTRYSGAEIGKLLGSASAYFAPSAAVEQMVAAVAGQHVAPMSVCAWRESHDGQGGAYTGQLARLGRNGVEEILEMALDAEEEQRLDDAIARATQSYTTLRSQLGNVINTKVHQAAN